MGPMRFAPSEIDGASPGKIFIGGLARETTLDTFTDYFGRYGEIVDSVIMKDRHTGRPRGFGFVTYADPLVVDTVIEETHIINGKQVEIKRTIPKGASQRSDFKTKKIFVGGIPASLSQDEFRNFFSRFGKVVEHEIIHDHATKRSRGFGFIVFDSEKVVDDLMADGNMIDMDGARVEIKKAEPKKASNPASGRAFSSDTRARGYGDGFRGFPDSLNGFDNGMGPASYRGFGGFGSRFGDYGGYSAGEFGGGYRTFDPAGGFGAYRGEPSMGYPGRYGSYGGGLGGYDGGRSGLGAYGRGADAYGPSSGPVAAYGSGPGAYGAGGFYGGNKAGYSKDSRYHPYAR